MDSSEPTNVATLAEECRRLTAALRLAEQDRQHLLYELHDGVIQDLTAAALRFDAANRPANSANEDYASGLRLLRGSIAEARRLLRGTAIDPLAADGLVIGLEQLVAKAGREWQLPVAFVTNCRQYQVTTAEQHLLVRIAQESLANAWKHARATEVEVQLTERDDCLELVIADNGVGFEPALNPAGHFGLESIRARAAALGADVVLDTAPNHGTRIVVRLPKAGERRT